MTPNPARAGEQPLLLRGKSRSPESFAPLLDAILSQDEIAALLLAIEAMLSGSDMEALALMKAHNGSERVIEAEATDWPWEAESGPESAPQDMGADGLEPPTSRV